jgi:hypothetical protein
MLPPVETIIDKASRVKVTKEDIMTLKKEYDTNFAKNPAKEIKRLPTLFDGTEEENKIEHKEKVSHKDRENNLLVQVNFIFWFA